MFRNVHIRVYRRAVLLHAEGRRIGGQDGREVLILEIGAAKCATAHIALEEPAVVELKARISLPGVKRQIAIHQSRYEQRAARVIKIFSCRRTPVPEPKREIGGIGVGRNIEGIVYPLADRDAGAALSMPPATAGAALSMPIATKLPKRATALNRQAAIRAHTCPCIDAQRPLFSCGTVLAFKLFAFVTNASCALSERFLLLMSE